MLYTRFLKLIFGLLLLLITLSVLCYVNAVSVPFKQSKHTFKKSVLRSHVRYLSQDIGERNIRKPEQLEKTIHYISSYLKNLDLKVETQQYLIQTNIDFLPISMRTKPFYAKNIYITLNAESSLAPLVVGAHYDTFIDTPGADDNASSVAILLEVVNKLSQNKILKRPIHFVFFTFEEPPFFQSSEMGSYQFAKMLKSKNIDLLGMISLDCLGYFSEKQSYPFPLNLFYSQQGDFLSIISSFKSYSFYKKVVANTFQNEKLKIENFSLPRIIPGVSYSDHWSFEQFSYPGILFTDSAFYRSDHYHEVSDTYETIDYEKLAEFSNILAKLLQSL